MDNLTISLSPSISQLANIEKWLEEEYESKHQGFYCNWYNSALPAHVTNRLAILLKGEEPIGFITWFIHYDKVAEIQLAEIKPGQRNKGFGKYLLNAILEKFSQAEISVARLRCQPAKTESVWKKLGFHNFPNLEDFMKANLPTGKHLFKILQNAAKVLEGNYIEGDLIELWAGQSRAISNGRPDWSWNPRFESGAHFLKPPIIVPAHYEWTMRWTRNKIVIYNGKIKKFRKLRLDFSDFLIISELPIPLNFYDLHNR
jgi:GNAT superfamily N-acetyltransferase